MKIIELCHQAPAWKASSTCNLVALLRFPRKCEERVFHNFRNAFYHNKVSLYMYIGIAFRTQLFITLHNIMIGSESGHTLASRKEWAIVPTPVFIRKKLWRDFCDHLTKQFGLTEEAIDIDATVELEVIDYFTNAVTRLEEDAKNWTESKLTETFLHPLYYSKHFVMEDTSNGIKDWNTAQRTLENDEASINFRKITFTGINENPQRVDFTLRNHCSGERKDHAFYQPVGYGESPVRTTGVDVPRWRHYPLNIISFLDIKKISEVLDNHAVQVCYYCESVLRTTPTRAICFGALTNLKSVLFVAVIRADNKYHWYRSGVDSSDSALQNLSTFLATSPKCLGKVAFDFPHDLFCPIKPLGRGSTSWVVEASMVSNPEITRAVKISCNKEALQVERRLLQYLHNNLIEEKWKAMLPRVDTDMQSKLHAACAEYITVIAPVAGKRTDGFVEKRMKEIWSLLREVHKLGIVHCDIRTPNIRISNDSQQPCMMLLDWSSARSFREVPDLDDMTSLWQSATMITASRQVLESIQMSETQFSCYPVDEGIAVIFCTLQWLLPNEKALNNACLTPSETKQTRSAFWESMDSSEIADLAQEVQNSIQEIENLSKLVESRDLVDSEALNTAVVKGIDTAIKFGKAAQNMG